MARPIYTEAQVTELQERIVSVALMLYREKGYEAVTQREIGSAVGVSHVTPFRYFASKEQLFCHVRAVLFDEFHLFIKKAVEEKDDAFDRLRAVATGFLDYAFTRQKDYQLLFTMRQPELNSESPLLLSRRRTLSFVMFCCQQAIDKKVIQGDARLVAHMMFAALHGAASLNVSNQLVDGCDLEDVVDGLLAGIFNRTGIDELEHFRRLKIET